MGSRTTEQQRLEWQKHFEAYNKSGLNKTKYCRLNNLSIDTFNYHLKKYLAHSAEPQSAMLNSNSNEFISLCVESSPDNIPPPLELSFEHQGQCLTLRVKWTISELLEFVNAWRAS